MRILAIDTTGDHGSVAVVADGEILGELGVRSEESHSRRLLPTVAFLLESVALDVAAIDAFAVATGPGSFTGTRVGISTIQGLCLATGRPCLGIAALDAFAAQAQDAAPQVVAVRNAYRGQLFAALYDGQGELQGPYRLVTGPELAGLISGPVAVVGDGVGLCRDVLARAGTTLRFPETSPFLAATIGRLAWLRLRSGAGGQAPRDLRPLYIREADVRRARG